MDISVILPTHNPDAGRLGRTLRALAAQDLPAGRWECLLVDNASTPPIEREKLAEAPAHLRVAREPRPGLSSARRCGFSAAGTPICVLVDDDNLLAPDYLSHVVRIFSEHPEVGAAGGRSLPEFEREPAPWVREFFPLLALRDDGGAPCISQGLQPAGAAEKNYPAKAAPLGAGMAIRKKAAMDWIADGGPDRLSDRLGQELTSGGDNDIILTIMEHGWEVGYFPELQLTHLIPSGRLEEDYLARLNYGIQKSWLQVLALHGASPWPAIPRWSVPLRKGKAWFTFRGWKGPAGHVRWRGVCGHYDGRVRLD